MDVAVDTAGQSPMQHGHSVPSHSTSAPSTQANGASDLGCDASHPHRRSRSAADPHAARAAANVSTSVQTPARRPSAAQLRRGEGAYGCSHYRRRCKLVAPCCPEVFWCRHCHNQVMHDDEKDPQRRHELDRSAVREVICALCSTQQPIAPHCSACGAGFGAYVCLKCSFFEDADDKQQFHCDACGICRVGGRDRFFHCDTCGCCYDKELQGNHVCVENSMRQNCPVCFDFLFDSTLPTAVLSCGHTIHSRCLHELQQANKTSCPICMKSYGDMTLAWLQMDREVERTPMPTDYAKWTADVSCNDCHATGNAKFHILGQKCGACGSYNTRRLTINKVPPDDALIPPPTAEAEGEVAPAAP